MQNDRQLEQPRHKHVADQTTLIYMDNVDLPSSADASQVIECDRQFGKVPCPKNRGIGFWSEARCSKIGHPMFDVTRGGANPEQIGVLAPFSKDKMAFKSFRKMPDESPKTNRGSTWMCSVVDEKNVYCQGS